MGFIPDLVAKLAKELKMPYHLRLVSEGGYGVRQEDGTFNGLLGEVISGVGICVLALWREDKWTRFADIFEFAFLHVNCWIIFIEMPFTIYCKGSI